MAPSDAELALRLPAYATRVVSLLEAAGYEAWVVGGWVRDALLGSSGHDVDVTTSAPWQETERVLRAAGVEVHETGVAHGTVTAVIGHEPVEVTTYRVEGAYSDLRHPDEVRFVTDVREDLARRDFTVNAMAWHPERGLLDPYGGREDLSRGLIRAVGDPSSRFGEDALRTLRAVRFACRLGFSIEPATQEALVACAPGLDHIARERVGIELDGIMGSGHMAWALRNEFEVVSRALPDLVPMAGFDQRTPYHTHDVLEHTARVCAGVEEYCGGVTPQSLRWAALFHDVAKPSCWSQDDDGRGHFYGHPKVSADMARRILGELALPKDLIAEVCALILFHDRGVWPAARSVRTVLAKLDERCPGRGEPLAFQLIDLKRADALAKAPGCAAYAVELDAVTIALRQEVSQGATFRVSDLAVSGGDVIRECGIAPGPAVGERLRGLLARVVDDELPNDREVLLAALRR